MDITKITNGAAAVSARNLIVSLEAKTGLKLFGGIVPFVDDAIRAEISGGNFRNFFEPFLNNFGIKAVIPSWTKIDDVLIAAADWLVENYRNSSFDLTETQLRRIAYEYAVSAVFTPYYERQSFKSYLEVAVQLRTAYKGFNKVAETSAPEAFHKSYKAWKETLETATTHFANIQTLLACNPHLRILRTKMAVFPIYSKRAYNALREMEPTTREVVVRAIVKGIRLTGSPIVNLSEVIWAHGEVKGNELISAGTPTGVTVEAATSALGVALFGEEPKSLNGGTVYEVGNLPLAMIGANLTGLNGYVEKATISSKGQDGLEIKMIVRDRTPRKFGGTAVVIDFQEQPTTLFGRRPQRRSAVATA